MRSERWLRVVEAGASSLDGKRWSATVGEAVKAVEDHDRDLYGPGAFDPASAPRVPRLSARPVYLPPGQVVIDAQTILDVERALTEAQQLADELKALASEDVDLARRARLQRTIDQCREAVARKLRGRGEA